MRRCIHLGVAVALASALALMHAPGVSAESRAVRCDRGANLQRAIDRAKPGDRLIIRGTCRGHFVVTKRLALIGADREARLHGGGSGQVLVIKRDPPFDPARGFLVRVTRLTVTRGDFGILVGEGDVRGELDRVTIVRNGSGLSAVRGIVVVRRSLVRGNGPSCGLLAGNGGITLLDSVVRDNRGSGVCIVDQSHFRSLASTIRGNEGRGIEVDFGAHIELEGSLIRENARGGISGAGSLLIRDSRIVGNDTDGVGGGIRLVDPKPPGQPLIIFDSTIRANEAGQSGGGIYIRYGDPSQFQPAFLHGVRFLKNRAGDAGGAVHSVDAPLQLTDVVFEGNEPDDCVGC
jgi:nitrous oxidase accessory protein NosD